MARRGEFPDIDGCKSERAPYALCGLFRTRRSRMHQWEYNPAWNGNNRKVLPFIDDPHGIARAGYRCYHCGEFRWDQNDTEFAFSVAHGLGLIKLPGKVPGKQEASA